MYKCNNQNQIPNNMSYSLRRNDTFERSYYKYNLFQIPEEQNSNYIFHLDRIELHKSLLVHLRKDHLFHNRCNLG